MIAKFRDIKLPSNRKFGFFFTLVFFSIFIYFFVNNNPFYSASSLFISVTFLLVTLIKPDFLKTLNRLWMFLGFIIGSVVSPLVLGVLFFGIFTPIAIAMRLFGRDELRLKKKYNSSHWIYRENSSSPTHSFRNQF